MNTTLKILLYGGATLAVGAGGYLLYKRYSNSPPSSPPPTSVGAGGGGSTGGGSTQYGAELQATTDARQGQKLVIKPALAGGFDAHQHVKAGDKVALSGWKRRQTWTQQQALAKVQELRNAQASLILPHTNKAVVALRINRNIAELQSNGWDYDFTREILFKNNTPIEQLEGQFTVASVTVAAIGTTKVKHVTLDQIWTPDHAIAAEGAIRFATQAASFAGAAQGFGNEGYSMIPFTSIT